MKPSQLSCKSMKDFSEPKLQHFSNLRKTLNSLAWGRFPDSLVSKESACKAGDPGSIPGSERCTGERISDPLQYSRAALVAQLVKNPPAVREAWAQSLGWEDPLEKGKNTHSSMQTWRFPWTIQSMNCKELKTTEQLSLSLFLTWDIWFSLIYK